VAKKGAKDKAGKADLIEPVLFTYIGNRGLGQHLLGVPMRDLTVADYDGLEDRFKEDLMGSSLYHQVGKLDDVRAESAKRRKGAKALYESELAKPPKGITDTDVTGRVDSDVLNAGQRVPPVDEPVGEGAPGFLSTDTSTTSAAEEG
jgi:hypothetical protein